MRIKILLSIMLVFVQTICANTNIYKPGGIQFEKYTIVYPQHADDNEGRQQAMSLQNKLNILTGKTNPVKSADELNKGPVIGIDKLQKGGTFDYSVKVRSGKIIIEGGSSWALNKATDEFIDYIKINPRAKSFQIDGSVEGEVLFTRPEGVNLRILDDNIWDYKEDTIPAVWQDVGIDCRNEARAPKFAQIVRAYMPDVLTLQEYSEKANKEFYKRIKEYGYKTAIEISKDGNFNHTPIFYREDSVELLRVNYNLYTPEHWCNNGSKSFTSAVFRQKSTGKIFAILNTHLMWRGDHIRPGSTFARTSQANLMLAEGEIIKHKYNCPIFVTGDMNCEENSMPMRQFTNAGYVPCYKAATVYGNKDNGHHICGKRDAGVRKSRRKGPDRETGAIDHCFIYNAGDSEIKVFDCIQDYFIVTMTDHYPNLIEARL